MNLKLTKKAEEEILKLTASEIPSINFSKMKIGNGSYTLEELENDITELKAVKIETEIAKTYQETINDKSQLFITSTFFNDKVDEKFSVREVGIYAISKADTNEYLYSYYLVAETDLAIAIVQDKSLPQYIPISVNTSLSNIDQVNITLVNDMLVVNQDQLERYKVNIKEYINEEDEAVKVYADEKDELIKTYVDEQDTEIRNTKADLIHGHNLTDENITGILPISKGGTGRDDGDADFNTMSVQDLLVKGVPVEPTKPSVPIGSITALAASMTSELPKGWLLCNGSSVPQADYPELWDFIGTRYGTVTDRIVLPNLNSRFLYGTNSSATVATGGASIHRLTIAEMPSHNHDIEYGSSSGGATFEIYRNPAHTSLNKEWVKNTGGGNPHNNMPPYMSMRYIIYAGWHTYRTT